MSGNLIVTGASRGIGSEIAKQFGAVGASVACIATSEANAAGTADAINAADGTAKAYGCRVNDSESVSQSHASATLFNDQDQ